MKTESIIIHLLTIVSIAILGFFLFFRIFYWEFVFPNVSAGSVPLGGLTLLESETLLQQKAAEWESRPIVFSSGGQVVSVAPEDLGIKIKPEETAKNAFSYGHSRKSIAGLLVFIGSGKFLDPYATDIANEIDAKKFMDAANSAFSGMEKKKINATLRYEQKKFAIIPPKDGIEIDRSDLLKKLEIRTLSFSSDPVELKSIKTLPDIESEDTLSAGKRAEQLISLPLIFSYNDKTWKVAGDVFAKWLSFTAMPDPGNPLKKILVTDVDKKTAEEYLKKIAAEINIEPVNAQLTSKNDKIEIFSLSKDGLELKIDENIEKISEALKDNRWLNDSPLPLVVAAKSPEITTESIDNMGITSLIGMGTSNFAGSPKNRRYNIGVGAAKFHGILIKPGEEFSFVKTLGPITKAEGYKAELVIKNGATIPELGGGLCQVSTTAFRAAIYSGLPITERQPHAYPVQYYNPQGMDATIYPPHPDLRFINDTQGYILIQTKIAGNNLTFEFYGSDDGRKIKVRGPQIYGKKTDGSMKAVFYRDIFRNDELVKTDTFRSNYKSPALYPHANPLE